MSSVEIYRKSKLPDYRYGARFMFSSRYLVIPFVLQLFWIGVDEFYFHHKRSLPKWERIGHPFDTITVLACLFWTIFVPPTARTVPIYVGLSIFSCLFILKDEGVHRQYCEPIEDWLHVFLFTLHPVVLISAGFLWPALHAQAFSLVNYQGWERLFLAGTSTVIVFFLFYQTVYWNFIWQPVDATGKRYVGASFLQQPKEFK